MPTMKRTTLALAAMSFATTIAMADVQVLLTSKKPDSSGSLEAIRITEVRDGDPVWVTVRSDKPLSDIASTETDSSGRVKYYHLAVTIGPAADTARDFDSGLCLLKLPAEWAAKKDFTMALSPGTVWGFNHDNSRGKSGIGGIEEVTTKARCFLESVAGGGSAPGRWKNRVSVRDYKVGSPTESKVIASAPLTVDVSGGTSRYGRARAALDDCTVNVGRPPAQCMPK